MCRISRENRPRTSWRPRRRTVGSWDRDLDALAAELRRARATVRDVPLPPTLTATQLLRLAADPDGFARELARPMPRPPQPAARRGTRFHAWVESRFEAAAAADARPRRAARRRRDEDRRSPTSAIWPRSRRPSHAPRTPDRTPYRVEAPFQLDPRGPGRPRPDRRRVPRPADGGDVTYEIVDWKTGRAHDADPLQLAVYRLAWAERQGLPLSSGHGRLPLRTQRRNRTPRELPGRAELERAARRADRRGELDETEREPRFERTCRTEDDRARARPIGS